MADPVSVSKSDKYNKAVARATGASGETQLMSEQDIAKLNADMIQKVNPEDITKMMQSGEWEFAPQLRKLEIDDVIAGVLEGNGPIAEFEHIDTSTRELVTNYVNTWIIASPDGTKRASILSSTQLDRKLPPFVGGMVKIVRGKDIQLAGGHRCTDYLVAGPRMPQGKTRNWATLPGQSTQAQLPAPVAPVAPPNGAGVEHDITAGTAQA